jgi:SPP1 family phage portal protein
MEELKYNFTGATGEIYDIINTHKRTRLEEIEKRNDYIRGNNTFIMERSAPQRGPDNRIPIPYARTIINEVKDFLYGNITYAGADEFYRNALIELFELNDEKIHTQELGGQVSTHGIGYEYFRYKNDGIITLYDGEEVPEKVSLIFERLPLAQTVVIYNYDITPRPTHFIYFQEMPEIRKEKVWVFDNRVVREYERGTDSKNFILINEIVHGFDRLPLVVYKNNAEMMGDFSAVISGINAYDVIISNLVNEIERHSWSFLKTQGFQFSDEQAEQLEHMNVLSMLNESDNVDYVTKEFNYEAFQYATDTLRRDIYKHSGIPNIDEYDFGANASGKTIEMWLYLMELFTGPKEAYFKKGLKSRIDLITNNLDYINGDPRSIEIIMNRNMPDRSRLHAELNQLWSSDVSRKTRLEQFADFIDNPEEEEELLRKEKEANMDMMDLDNIMENEGPEEDED